MDSSVELLWPGIHPYVACLAASALISFCVLFFDVRRNGLSLKTGFCFALTAIPLGIVGAKLFYFFAKFELLYALYGLGGLLRFRIGEFAFTGALLGMLAATAISALLTRRKPQKVMDAVAAASMLFLALARFGEYFVEFGTGPYVYNESFQFFPLAVKNIYDEWYAAVFMLEGLIALILFLLLFLRRFAGAYHKSDVGLLLFVLSQVFCESLRAESLKWGFVRVQQLSCVVLAAVILVKYSIQILKNGGGIGRILPQAGIFLLGIGICVGVEFALDKTNIPQPVSYSAMLLALFAMGAVTLLQMRAAWTSKKSTVESI
jgi:phosphatidylglycerol:prolipoprotein diacylglycerol transferase